jgi:hypothetical protein
LPTLRGKDLCIVRRIYLSSALFIQLMSAALAQPAAGLMPLQQLDTPDAKVRINLSISIFVTASKKDQALKAQEQVRRMIYGLAGHECTVLRDAIASECKLQSISVSAQRAPSSGEQEPEGFNVSGNIGFRIVPKQ